MLRGMLADPTLPGATSDFSADVSDEWEGAILQFTRSVHSIACGQADKGTVLPEATLLLCDLPELVPCEYVSCSASAALSAIGAASAVPAAALPRPGQAAGSDDPLPADVVAPAVAVLPHTGEAAGSAACLPADAATPAVAVLPHTGEATVNAASIAADVATGGADALDEVSVSDQGHSALPEVGCDDSALRELQQAGLLADAPDGGQLSTSQPAHAEMAPARHATSQVPHPDGAAAVQARASDLLVGRRGRAERGACLDPSLPVFRAAVRASAVQQRGLHWKRVVALQRQVQAFTPEDWAAMRRVAAQVAAPLAPARVANDGASACPADSDGVHDASIGSAGAIAMVPDLGSLYGVDCHAAGNDESGQHTGSEGADTHGTAPAEEHGERDADEVSAAEAAVADARNVCASSYLAYAGENLLADEAGPAADTVARTRVPWVKPPCDAVENDGDESCDMSGDADGVDPVLASWQAILSTHPGFR
jgi:hypothetical protein